MKAFEIKHCHFFIPLLDSQMKACITEHKDIVSSLSSLPSHNVNMLDITLAEKQKHLYPDVVTDVSWTNLTHVPAIKKIILKHFQTTLNPHITSSFHHNTVKGFQELTTSKLHRTMKKYQFNRLNLFRWSRGISSRGISRWQPMKYWRSGAGGGKKVWFYLVLCGKIKSHTCPYY